MTAPSSWSQQRSSSQPEVLSSLTCRSGLSAVSLLQNRGKAALVFCKYFCAVFKEIHHVPCYLWSSEQDGFAGCFLLHVRGKALEELGVLPLGHSPEHRGRSPATRVHCTHSGVEIQFQ